MIENGTVFYAIECSKESGANEKGEVVALRNGSRSRPDIKCYNCNKPGHFANQYSDTDNNKEGTTTISWK
eukprot:2529227-Ditylum_brightwellii.AAC.1